MRRLFVILLLLLPAAVRAQEKFLEVNAQVQNIGLFKTDSDFDDTEPYYNPSGQTVGFFGTFFKPALTFLVKDLLTFYYEVELGLNIWSRNSVEQLYGENRDTLTFKHRQIYAEGKLGRKINFRIGYQYFKDPSGLFINHWLGGALIRTESETLPIGIFIGQLPDQTYEGWEVSRNNFTQDRFVFSLFTYRELDGWKIEPGVSYFYDGVYVKKQRWLLSPAISAHKSLKNAELGFDIALQIGRTNHGAYDGEDETNLGGGIQFYLLQGLAMEGFGKTVGEKVVPGAGTEDRFRYGWGINLLLLSPDDHLHHNGTNYAFLYSGRSRSPTLILTEDEFRDRGDNLDEFTGERISTLYSMRAGYLLVDGSFYYRLRKDLLFSSILGNAILLNKRNALDNIYFGTEFDVILRYIVSSNIVIDLINTLFLPGKGASAFVNTIDRDNAVPQYMVEISLNAFF